MLFIMTDIINNIKTWMENSIVDEIILLAIFVAFVESFAQNTIKSSEHGSLKFILGLAFYMIVGYILHYAYHKFPLGKMNVVWSCISIILAMFIGYLFYDEPMNNWNISSIVLAIAAVYCSYKADHI